jgi:sugar lactone lactonase YvrE
MALETFEAGYAGARPARTGSQWSGMWKLGQITDRQIDGKWPSPWSVSGSNQTKSFAIVPGDSSPFDVQFNDDGTKFYIMGATKRIIYQYTCATAWDVNTASYSGKSFYVGNQDTTTTALFFKSDGTQFYVLGDTNNNIYQYSCSIAWDVSTASYDNKSFNVFGQESAPNALFFKSDGTQFYVLGTASDRVFQYSCSTAWDVSTASYDSKQFNVNTQESQPTGLFFKSDGTKFYVVGQISDTVYQYSCSTAWDVSTASYDSKSFSVVTQETSPQGLFFKSDGTVFYIVGTTNDIVFQYSCSTAWDVSTASYGGKAFYVGAGQETTPQDIQFNDDGTKFYIVGNVNDTVYQYSCSTAWDVSTGSFDSKSFYIGGQEAISQGLFFKSDGTAFYVVGSSTDTVYQYSCSTAWDVSTASYASKSFSVVTQDTTPVGLFFKPDGTKFYIVGDSNNTVYQYSCSTAWDVSTASYDSKSFSVAAQDTIPQALFFKSDGTILYILGSNSRAVYQYTVSTAWDVSTASYASKVFSVSVQLSAETLTGISFKSDGTKFYISGSNLDTIYQYSCTTAWEMNATSTYDSKSFSVATQDTGPTEIQFKDDGTKFYIIGGGTDTIYQYSCSTAWDVSTASYDTKSFSINAQESNPHGLFFKSDGTKFYVVGNTNDTVYQYSCSTAWDVSTASYDNKFFSVATQELTPLGLFFKSDGAKFYIVGSAGGRVQQYSCATAWDISTASYDSKFFRVVTEEPTPTGLFFKSDGTKFYVVGTVYDTIFQYSCAAAWDVGTASYDARLFSVASQETTPNGLFFKSDGAKFYIVGQTNDTVYQYSTVAAWEVQSPFYDSKFFRVVTEEPTPTGLFFKSDGTKFYVVGTVYDTIFQYSCSTAWDIGAGIYDNKSFTVAAQDADPNGLFFKPDGTKFYIAGGSNRTIYQYSCSTAWDVSTGAYDSKSFNITAQETNIRALFFKPDGTKFYIVGISNDTVYQYSCSTAWDISTAFYESKLFSVNAQEVTPQAVFFKDDGTKFYIVGQGSDSVFQYSCVTAWDVSTASYDGVLYSISTQDTSPTDVQFKSDGTSFYVLGDSTDTIYQYSVLLQ